LIDRRSQELRPLALPTGFFRIRSLVNECLQVAVRTVFRALWQDFDDSPPSTKQHEGLIHDNACQPGREPCFFLKVVEMKENLVKTLLRHVLGVLLVSGNALRHGKNSLLVTKNQFLESLLISVLGGGNKRFVGIFVRAGRARRCHESGPPLSLRHKVRETYYRASHSAYRMDWNIVQ
jgi:hypothetical protein